MKKIIVLLSIISIFLIAGCDYEKDGEFIPTGIGTPKGMNEEYGVKAEINNKETDTKKTTPENVGSKETEKLQEEPEINDTSENNMSIVGNELIEDDKSEVNEIEGEAVEIGNLVNVGEEQEKEPRYCFIIDDIYQNLTYNNDYLKGYVDTIEICKSYNGKEKFIMHDSYKRNMMDSGSTIIYDSNLEEVCWYVGFGRTNCELEFEQKIDYDGCEEVCGYGSQECRELIKGQKYECPILEKITFKGNCSEVDNKKNYYVKGNSSYIEGNYTVFDYCLNSSRFHTGETEECEGEDCLLIETYCSPAYVDYSNTVSLKGLNRINLEKYKCPNGCRDGVCIRE